MQPKTLACLIGAGYSFAGGLPLTKDLIQVDAATVAGVEIIKGSVGGALVRVLPHSVPVYKPSLSLRLTRGR